MLLHGGSGEVSFHIHSRYWLSSAPCRYRAPCFLPGCQQGAQFCCCTLAIFFFLMLCMCPFPPMAGWVLLMLWVIPFFFFSCLNPLTKNLPLLWRPHGVRQNRLQGYPYRRSLTLIPSANSLLPCDRTHSQFSEMRAWTFGGGGSFSLLLLAGKSPFASKHSNVCRVK